MTDAAAASGAGASTASGAEASSVSGAGASSRDDLATEDLKGQLAESQQRVAQLESERSLVSSGRADMQMALEVRHELVTDLQQQLRAKVPEKWCGTTTSAADGFERMKRTLHRILVIQEATDCRKRIYRWKEHCIFRV